MAGLPAGGGGRSTIPLAVQAAHHDNPLCHRVASTSTTSNAPLWRRSRRWRGMGILSGRKRCIARATGAANALLTSISGSTDRTIVRTALFLVVRCALGARYDVLSLMHQGAVALRQPDRRWCRVSRGARRRGLLRHGHAVSLDDSASGGVVVARDLTTAQHLRRAEGSGYNTCKPHSLAQSLGEDTDGNDPWCRAGLTLFPRTK